MPATESLPNPLQRQAGFAVPSALVVEIDELVTHYPVKRSASLMVLHALQDHFGWISQDAVEWTAGKLGLEPINIYELVTFYPMFRSQPSGKYQIKVCRTLSCALGGSQRTDRGVSLSNGRGAGAWAGSIQFAHGDAFPQQRWTLPHRSPRRWAAAGVDRRYRGIADRIARQRRRAPRYPSDAARLQRQGLHG